MQKGRVVEGGDARAVLDDPQHPYSKLLKSAVLSPDNVGIDPQATMHGADPNTVPVDVRTV
jgi:ABC-type dipeptide/oligopeptide/nickel transport system ATPase component